MNTIEKISVRQLKNQGLEMNVLEDDVILSSNIEVKDNLFDTPRRLDAFMLVFCVNGEADIQINLHKYKMYPGILAFNIPENIIQIRNMKNLKIHPIIISSDFLKRMNIKMNDLMKLYIFAKKVPFVSLEYAELMTLEKYYFLLEDIILSKESQKEVVMEGVIHSLFCKLNSIIQRLQGMDHNFPAKERNEEIFECFMENLTLYHTTERSLNFYAGKMGITANYLSKLIKECTGRTAVEWIDEYVILEAKSMIKHTQFTIQEIAYKLNFPSPSFFGKYFKRLTGMSPKQYKQS